MYQLAMQRLHNKACASADAVRHTALLHTCLDNEVVHGLTSRGGRGLCTTKVEEGARGDNDARDTAPGKACRGAGRASKPSRLHT